MSCVIEDTLMVDHEKNELEVENCKEFEAFKASLMDAARVAGFRDKIRDGKYQIDADLIALRMFGVF